MEHIEHKVNLSYLGDRNYIDISTISYNFFKSCGHDIYQASPDYESIRILKKITRNGILTESKPTNASCIFKYKINSQKKIYYYIENSTIITSRTIEDAYNREEFFIIKDNTGRFIKPINTFMTYNLMCLGKSLIVANTDLTPRVVQTELNFHIEPNQYEFISMKLFFLKNNFILLQTFVHDVFHGKIFVKLI